MKKEEIEKLANKYFNKFKSIDNRDYFYGFITGFEKAQNMFSPLSWIAYDWNIIETRPTEYGKYLICRKDGKIHWETWNSSGWAYNHKEIRFWAKINPPQI